MKIKVGYADYTEKKTTLRESTLLTDNTSGLCDFDSLTIYIKSGLNRRVEGEVRIHEILHAIASMWSLNLSHEEEERVVSLFSLGLATVIHDNPALFTEIIKQLK